MEEFDNFVGGLAVVIFVLLSALGFLLLPFIKKEFSPNEYANIIIRRGCWVIGIYLMMLNSVIVVEISSHITGASLSQELFRYMWIYGTIGYLMLGFLVLGTLLETMKLYKFKKEKKRMGDDGE